MYTPKRRHLKRYREIANTLVNHGLGFLLDQTGLKEFHPPWKARKAAEHLSRGRRLRYALEELGPTFIKLGQILSTRPDLLPRDIIRELSYLQDEVAPFAAGEAKRLIEAELGNPVEELFARFDEQPVAAASIGQVHRGALPTGEEVVIKVQRPGVRDQIEVDLEILFEMARFARDHTPWGEIYDFVALAEEFDQTLKAELDYTREGLNAERMAGSFRDNPRVYIPRVYWEYSTPKVLTLEYLNGIKLSDLEPERMPDFNAQKVADTLVESFFKMVLEDGFFHADPHPGNLLVLPGDVVGFLDFGMAGTLSQRDREYFASLIIGMMLHNSRQVVNTILDMGIVTTELDLDAFRKEVEVLRNRYYQKSFEEIEIAQALNELLELAFKYKVRIPAEFALLGKALLTLESLAMTLDPELSIVRIAEPYGKRLLRKRLSPRRLFGDLGENLLEHGGILLDLPGIIATVLEKLQHDQMRFRLRHENMDDLYLQLNKIANRLSFGLVMLALSIILGALILGGTPGNGLLSRLPLAEIGLVAFGVLLLGWFWRAYRSGWF